MFQLSKLVIQLYNIIFTLSLPLIWIRLLYRSCKNPAYRQRMFERVGIFKAPLETKGIWIHAVSVGEVVAAQPLVKALQSQFPGLPIVLTTTTPTGSHQAKKLFKDSIFHVYFPYDLFWTLSLFLKKIKPVLCIIMETELWPNLLQCLNKKQIPIVIANGRVSEKSFKKYQRISFLTKWMMQQINHVAAQSDNDAKRFIQLGLNETHITNTGNLKFEVKLEENSVEKATEMKQQWGVNRRVIIAASTHAGEETQILWAYAQLKKHFSDLLLIIVPRHPERFESVASEIEKQGFSYARRSQNEVNLLNLDVFLVDAMGELPLFYAASDIAFVGGSLVPIGGHNCLEPAALGLPILVGPHMQNFADITARLKSKEALIQIQTKEALFQSLKMFIDNPTKMKDMGNNAKTFVLENQGVVFKLLKILNPYLSAANVPTKY